jgi:hypothetical protein
MLKVTPLLGAIFLKVLLFNGCNGPSGSSREEIRYENKLDSLYERKIDSAYVRIGRTCDSTLEARWSVLSDSILHGRFVLDSLAHAQDSLAHIQDSLAHPKPIHHAHHHHT